MKVQIRPRAEYGTGCYSPGLKMPSPPGLSITVPAFFGYERDRLSIGLSAQHVGVWGQDPQIDKNGRFILNGGGITISDRVSSLVRSPVVGIYDDERIMGALDWNVAGRYHDALKLGHENTNNQLHLILAFNQNDEKTTRNVLRSGRTTL